MLKERKQFDEPHWQHEDGLPHRSGQFASRHLQSCPEGLSRAACQRMADEYSELKRMAEQGWPRLL